MSEPRLTIGIPTLDRFDHLPNAIRDAIGQQMPCKVVVADQGQVQDTREICQEWADHPGFKRIDSPATSLWENWRFVAEAAIEDGAEFFMWLQDDDYICEKLSRRIIRAFDFWPDATVYCSNLAMSYDSNLGCNWVTNPGPKVPVDVRQGKPSAWPGNLLAVIGYLDSWCMSPAKAFRVTDQFKRMLRELPDDCDCFTERLDIAGAALGSRFIVDPKRAGCWHIHMRNEQGRNESQITGEKQAAQVAPAYAYLDTLMDHIPNWRQELAGWMGTLGNANLIKTYYDTVKDYKHDSLYAVQIVDILEIALESAGVPITKKAEPADVNGDLVTA